MYVCVYVCMYVCVCVCAYQMYPVVLFAARQVFACMYSCICMRMCIYACLCVPNHCAGVTNYSRGDTRARFISLPIPRFVKKYYHFFSHASVRAFFLYALFYAFFNALLAVLFFPLMSFFVTGVRSRCTDLWKWWGGVRSQDSATWQHSFGIYMCVHTYSHWCTDAYGCICIHWQTLRLDNAALVWGGYDS